MKTNKKNLLKIGLFIISAIVLITSCQKNDDYQSDENSIAIKHITKTKLAENEILKPIIQTIDKKNEISKKLFELNNKNITSNDSLFIIHTDHIYETTIDNTTNYSFYLSRNEEDNNFYENFVISEENEIYSYYILKFFKDNSEIASSTIVNKNIVNQNILNFLNKMQILDDCIEISYLPCSGSGDADGHAAVDGYCNGSATVLDFSNCDGGGGSGQGSSGNQGSNGNQDNSGNQSSNDNQGQSNNYTPGGSSTPNGAVATIKFNVKEFKRETVNNFFDSLTTDQYNALSTSNIADITNFISNNIEPFISADDNSNQQVINFANEAVDALINNGEVDFDDNIIYDIVDKDCQKQIIKDIIATSSPFTDLINETFGTSDKVNLKFTTGNSNPNAAAGTVADYSGNSNSFTIEISFNDNYLVNATNLSIIAITLHEMVHAHLINLYIKGELVANSDDYDDLLTAFISYYESVTPDTASNLNNEIHDAMINFISTMGNSIYNYASANDIDGVTADYATHLAWGTMSGTNLFQEILTPQQQIEYNNIANSEQENHYDPKGTPCN